MLTPVQAWVVFLTLSVFRVVRVRAGPAVGRAAKIEMVGRQLVARMASWPIT